MFGFLYDFLRKHHKVEWKVGPVSCKECMPKKAHPSDAGFDLFCAEKERGIPPHGMALVDLGFKCSLPEGYELQIRPKSGLAAKNCLTILNSPGTVDCHYRGQVKAIVMNHGDLPYTFHLGDKVCQGVVCELPYVKILQVSSQEKTDRGEGGFGSTGK